MRLFLKPLSAIASAVCLVCIFFIAMPLAAAEQAVEPAVTSAEQPSTPKQAPTAAGDKLAAADKSAGGAYVMQLVVSLVVVLLAIAVLAWLMKRLNRLPGRSAGNMRVLSAMALGARERAVLVQVGDTQMLLGVSPGRVSTLHVFDEPVVDASSAGEPATNFASILGNLGKGGGR